MIQGLIVNDDAAIRSVVADAVGQQGRGLLQAGSNAELVELLEAQTPDIILLDILIPRLRRKIEPYPHAPRLIPTERGAGYVVDADVERC